MKENQTETSRNNDRRQSDPSSQTGVDTTSLLIKLQHQLSHLERKIDGVINMLQEKQYGGNSRGDKPFPRKSHLRTSQASGRFGDRRIGKRSEKSGEKNPDQAFYSRFTKPAGRSGTGSGKKPFRRKPNKRTYDSPQAPTTR